MKKKIVKNQAGITLVALVVTIVVLLILAGITLVYVFGDNGVFGQARDAKEQTEIAKAKEKLEVVLTSVQIQKYTDPDYNENEFLDSLIETKVEGAEVVDDKVIVDGYIFELERSIPAIGENVERAGVIITARVSGNQGWQKESKATITGKILSYSGGKITTVSAKEGEEPIANFAINPSDGSYVIETTKNTTVKINAEDSEGKTAEREIPITIKLDNTAPTVLTLDAKTEGTTIIFSATGHDKNGEGIEESGIKNFNYIITSSQDTTLEGIPEEQRIGAFKQGQLVKIQTTATGGREETTYTITVTATDNVDNTTSSSAAKTENIAIIDGLTIAQAKQINKDSIRENIGKRVIDYIPKAKGIYRVFYFDDSGEFGPENTLYLKRDYDSSLVGCLPIDRVTSKGTEIMKRMNPKWRDYPTADSNIIDMDREKAVSWLCDPDNWEDYKSPNSSFAIGGPSVEMYMKAYNLWKSGDKDANDLVCKVESADGYSVGANGSYIDSGKATADNSLNYDSVGIFVSPEYNFWLSSPAKGTNSSSPYVLQVMSSSRFIDYCTCTNSTYDNSRLCPVVPLDL